MLLVVVMLMWIVGCNLVEINMVNRSIMDRGDGTSSSHQEVTTKEDEDKLELIVPIK